jgi:hypothetical protein
MTLQLHAPVSEYRKHTHGVTLTPGTRFMTNSAATIDFALPTSASLRRATDHDEPYMNRLTSERCISVAGNATWSMQHIQSVRMEFRTDQPWVKHSGLKWKMKTQTHRNKNCRFRLEISMVSMSITWISLNPTAFSCDEILCAR